MSEHFPDTDYSEIRTVMRGREETQVTVIEFHSRSDRDAVLKWYKDEGSPKLLGSAIRADYAKTSKQLMRNSAMKRAAELIKADGRVSAANVVINWKVDDSKNRTVTADGNVIFMQEKHDALGTFIEDFNDLVLE